MKHGKFQLVVACAFAVLAGASTAGATIIEIDQPGDSAFCGTYDTCATLLPITATNPNTFGSVTDGTEIASFSLALTAAVVPGSWSLWNSPPAVESSTPTIGYTTTIGTETITFNAAVELFGFELEPNNPDPEDVTVTYYSGVTSLGTVELSPNGFSGALLFAGDAGSNVITSVTIDDADSDTFALANFRYADAPATPEPASLMLSACGLLGLALVARRRFQA